MREWLRALRLMVEISLRADMPRSIAAVVTAAGQMGTPPLRVIGLRQATDGIVIGNVEAAVGGIALILGLIGLTRLFTWASLNVRVRLRENTQVYLDAHLMALTAGIPGMEHHERPDYLDNVERVRSERWALANPFNPISWSIASIVQVASVCVLLASVHPLLLLLPLCGLPSLITNLFWLRADVRLREAQDEPNRIARHLRELTTEQAAAKEIRIYGLAHTLMQRRRQLFDQLERDWVRTTVPFAAVAAAAWGIFAVCFALVVAFTVGLAAQQVVTVGAVMLVLGLSTQLNGQLEALVYNLAWGVRTHNAVTKLVWLQDYARHAHESVVPAAPQAVPARLKHGITLEDVSFRYPETERAVLDGVNLVLEAGSTIAIVGENGAGKTTLIKLLSRFYEPTGGRILGDDVELRSLHVDEWRARMAAGFQDFARLLLLARESIGVGDKEHIERDASIFSALQRSAAGDLPAKLPQALDTQLGRTFPNGVDLSLGQWQKVALTRAMMRERVLLLLLDEPTASLDAPTEHALFEHFAEAAREYASSSGAITVLVSHRFSTVRMADQIVVVSGGRVVEHGSHDELVRLGGLYAELYGLQASAYR